MGDGCLIKIVVICGPTGVGKTGFAIELARQFGGQIVGADSMQIYRCMDIGTAKPTFAEKAAAVHHMVDIVDPQEKFDAAEYIRMAESCIAQIVAQGGLPFIVGGTGLYIKALLYGLTEAAPTNETVRARLKDETDKLGGAAMHARLAAVDSQSARRIHINDTYRVLRALEVYEITGKTISDHHNEHHFGHVRYQPLQIGLTLPRQALYERINHRVDAMIEQGLLNEVRSLLALGLEPQLKSMQSLGYRHMIRYLQGELDWPEAVRTLKRDHRRYAKRQLTWFGNDSTIQWLQPHQSGDAAHWIQSFLADS